MDGVVELPNEVWWNIFSHLDYHSLRYATVSKFFNSRIVFQSITSLSNLLRCYSKSKPKTTINDEFIKQFVSLRTFDIRNFEGTTITDIGIKSMKNLTHLDLRMTTFIQPIPITNDGIKG